MYKNTNILANQSLSSILKHNEKSVGLWSAISLLETGISNYRNTQEYTGIRRNTQEYLDTSFILDGNVNILMENYRLPTKFRKLKRKKKRSVSKTTYFAVRCDFGSSSLQRLYHGYQRMYCIIFFGEFD